MKLKEMTFSLKQRLYFFACNSKNRWLTVSILFLVLFSIFLFKINLSNKINVQFGSDEWDYQTIAVNFALGHGFHVTGNFEKPDVYKFGQLDTGIFEKQELLKGITNIHRPPLYSFVIGLIYKIVGVNPSCVVIFQLFLLCIVAAGLPLLGFFLWQYKGFYSGIVSSVLFLCFNYKMAEIFLPGQSFTVFWIFIFISISENFFKKKTPLWAAMTALVLSVSLLFHATMILVVGFIGISLLLDLKNRNNKKGIYNLLAFAVIFIIILLPWHLFAFKTLRTLKLDASVVLSASIDTTLSSIEKNKLIYQNAPRYGMYLMPQKDFTTAEIIIINDSLIPEVKNNGVFFSNINASSIDFYKIALLQEILDAPNHFLIFLSITKNIAMDCHNEYIDKGYSNPEWRFNKNSFYSNDNLKNKISFFRVYNFYKHNPEYLLPLIIMKINAALNSFVFLKLFFLLTILYLISKISNTYSLNKHWLLLFISIFLILAGVLINSHFLITLLLIGYIVFLGVSYIIKSKHKIPISFNFIFFNLIIFSLIALGNSRYFNVLDSFFILLSIYYFQKVTTNFFRYLNLSF